jgi:hypothetical protein
LNFVVAAGDRRVEASALIVVQIVTVVDDSEIDLGPFRSIVGFVELQPTFMNQRLELQHAPTLARCSPSGYVGGAWQLCRRCRPSSAEKLRRKRHVPHERRVGGAWQRFARG